MLRSAASAGGGSRLSRHFPASAVANPARACINAIPVNWLFVSHRSIDRRRWPSFVALRFNQAMQGAAILFSLSDALQGREDRGALDTRPAADCFSCGAPLRSREEKNLRSSISVPMDAKISRRRCVCFRKTSFGQNSVPITDGISGTHP